VSFPDGPPVADGYFAICLNTNPYTFLGNRPLDVAPDAGFDHGLVMLTIRSMRFDRIIRIIGRALQGGGAVGHDRWVDHRGDQRGLLVTSDRPFPYQVDGDFLGEVTRLEFRHEPDAMRLVLPVERSEPMASVR
jgi:diacylglycerol kinase family enzyme